MDVVLEVIVAIRSPVVVAFSDEIIDEPLTLRIGEHLTSREESIFQILDRLLAALEARQVVLTEEHHFDNDNNLLSIFLQRHKSELHEFTVFNEFL